MRGIVACVLLCSACASEPERNVNATELLLASRHRPRLIGFGADEEPQVVFRYDEMQLCSPRWSPDGRFLTVETCSSDEALLVSFPHREVEVLGRDLAPQWSPTRGTLILGTDTVFELDPDTMESQMLSLPSGQRTWSPTRDEVAVVQGGSVEIFDVATAEVVSTVSLAVDLGWGPSLPELTALHWSPEGDAILARAGLRMLFLLRLDSQTIELWTLPDWTENDVVYGVDWARDGRVAVSRSSPGRQRVEIYDAPLGSAVHVLEGATDPVWADDGRLAVLTDAKGTLEVYTPEFTVAWSSDAEAPESMAWRP